MTEQRLSLINPSIGRTADNHIVGLFRCVCGAEVRVLKRGKLEGVTHA